MRFCSPPTRVLGLLLTLTAACPAPSPSRPDAADLADPADLSVTASPDLSGGAQGDASLPDSGAPDLATSLDLTAPPDLGGARCREPADCPSQVCVDASAGAGACARPEDVIYVDNRAAACPGTHSGAQADPLCTLAEALALPLPGRLRRVRLAPSATRYDGADLSESVALYGPGLQVMAAQRATLRGVVATGYAALRVIEPAGRPQPLDVTIDGVDLTSSLTLGVEGALRCQGQGRTALTVVRSQIYSSASVGISTSACVVALSRVLMNSTTLGGLKVEDGSAEVVNSFFINSPRGPALLTSGSAALRARFSTFVGNGAAGASGVSDCQSTKACVIESSLLVQNKRPAGGSQLGGRVQLSESALDEAMAPGANLRYNAAPEFAGPSNYRLAPGPGSRACCIDQLPLGAGNRDVPWDYDGNGRPAGQGYDIGGFEVQ